MSDKAGGQKIGGTVGAIGGGIAGSYYGGPIGGIVGSYTGNLLGSAIGGGIGSLFGGGGSNPQTSQQKALYDEQQQQIANLQAQAAGQGPSLAGIQLGQGLDQIQRQTGANIAGTTGNNGVLGRYAAIQAGANASSAEDQAAAIARAKEIQDANAQLGSLLGGGYSTATGAQTAAGQLGIQQQQINNQLLGSGLNALAQGGAFKASQAPAVGGFGSSGGGGSLNFTAPTDEDGVATLAS